MNAVYRCKLCPDVFADAMSAAVHVQSKHPEVFAEIVQTTDPANPVIEWQCALCDDKAPTRTGLEGHLFAVHGLTIKLDPAGYELPAEPEPEPPAKAEPVKAASARKAPARRPMKPRPGSRS